MLALASISTEFFNAVGGAAAVMAVGIFIGQARYALAGASEAEIRRGAARGGVVALCVVLGVVVLSAFLS